MKKRFFAGMLAAVMLTASAGFANVLAEEAVYSYMDEDGNNITITQSQLDEGHWNTDALGENTFYVYEDFPAHLEKNVNQMSDLSIIVSYMKNVTEEDAVTFTITNLRTNKIVENVSISSDNAGFETSKLDMNQIYRLTITEAFAGEECKIYEKIIQTGIFEADMPDYVKNPKADDQEHYIGIALIDDLVASETVEEDGSITVDGRMKRYEKMTIADWVSYRNTLASDKLYKIIAIDDNTKYRGFLSTAPESAELGIYMPDYTVTTLDKLNSPTVYAVSESPRITWSDVSNAEKYDYPGIGDTLLGMANSTAYRVIRVKLTENLMDSWFDADAPIYYFETYMNYGVTVETWYCKNSTVVPIYLSESTFRTGSGYFTATLTDKNNEPLTVGDTLFFVIYNNEGARLRGLLNFKPIEYTDDIMDTAHDLIVKNKYVAITEKTSTQLYTMTDILDRDTFYINPGSVDELVLTINNQKPVNDEINTVMRIKYMDIYEYNKTSYGFDLNVAYEDFVAAMAQNSRYKLYSNTGCKYFAVIYDANTSNIQSKVKPSNYRFGVSNRV